MGHQFYIDGEYSRVSQMSQEKDLLTIAYQTPITPQYATNLIHMLANRYRLREFWIEFQPGTYRGEAGFDDSNLREFFFRLPAKPKPPRATSYNHLTLGLVLHEFAHVIKIRRENYLDKTRAHSKVFVKILDDLLREFVA